jgi:xylulokinase
MKYAIGVDIGTSGTKSVLFDQKGTVISSATVEFLFISHKWLC